MGKVPSAYVYVYKIVPIVLNLVHHYGLKEESYYAQNQLNG